MYLMAVIITMLFISLVKLSNPIVGPNLLENQAKPGDFYSWLGKYLKYELKPKAIVIISAHWQGEGSDTIFGNSILIYIFFF